MKKVKKEGGRKKKKKKKSAFLTTPRCLTRVHLHGLYGVEKEEQGIDCGACDECE
jgi:hypothetical protein